MVLHCYVKCVRWLFIASLLFARTVLVHSIIDIEKLKPNEIAILQYDSREPDDYWLSAAKWNNDYCKKHGHIFIYYTTREGCHYGVQKEKLADPWCKVKSMIAADEDYPDVKLFIYMDSDAVVDRRFSDYSLNSLMHIMQVKLSWDPEKKPIVFNQDGSCWWCNLVVDRGYDMCLNAGTVVWYRHSNSYKVLKQWWDASMDSYATNPIKRAFRLKWPWEQDRQMAVYNRSSHLIQVASQPDRIHMQSKIGFTDWCLSHLPEAGCFISHYCANSHAKQVMKKVYSIEKEALSLNADPSVEFDFKVNYLIFE